MVECRSALSPAAVEGEAIDKAVAYCPVVLALTSHSESMIRAVERQSDAHGPVPHTPPRDDDGSDAE